MDIFAHGLWSYAIFSKDKRKAAFAALFGIAPDLISFGPFVLYGLVTGGRFGPTAIPDYVHLVYTFTHSFIIFILALLLTYVFTKKIFLPMLMWALHILVDIPTHTAAFFPTPFLWPISNIHFDGIRWSSKWFMIINYSALSIVYAAILLKARKKRTFKS